MKDRGLDEGLYIRRPSAQHGPDPIANRFVSRHPYRADLAGADITVNEAWSTHSCSQLLLSQMMLARPPADLCCEYSRARGVPARMPKFSVHACRRTLHFL